MFRLMFRLKTIWGGKLRACQVNKQAVALFSQWAALNRMMPIVQPASDEVEASYQDDRMANLSLLNQATKPFETMNGVGLVAIGAGGKRPSLQ